MKHGSIVLLLSLMMMPVLVTVGQGTTLYLTKYLVEAGSDVVGEVKFRGGTVLNAEVSGTNAVLFAVGNDNVLRVNAGAVTADSDRHEVTIIAQTSAGDASETFVILNDRFARNKVIAHRGAWKNTKVPENSIAALRHAVRLGCEGSEFDVHMSADSVPFVNHDATIQGLSIAKSKASDLASVRLPNGEAIPTLESYIRAGMEQFKTRLVLEIKSSELGKEHSLALARKVVSIVEELHAQAWTDYIAFDPDVCKEVLRSAPYARVAYLNGDRSPAELARDGFFGLDYHFNVLKKNPSWINEAHAAGLTVNVWTVNDRSAMVQLLKQGADFITTNEPEMLLELVSK